MSKPLQQPCHDTLPRLISFSLDAMKASRGVITLLAISAALALGQAPSVPKLPHVPTGKMTASGFRLYGEKNITAQRPYS
jgi:hypothetical protein